MTRQRPSTLAQTIAALGRHNLIVMDASQYADLCALAAEAPPLDRLDLDLAAMTGRRR